MQLVLTFKNEGDLHIPIHYNHLIQGLIYNNIKPGLAEFLHKQGFMYEKRSFKLFTFSRLLGKARLHKESRSLIFQKGIIKLIISSPLERFCRELSNSVLLSNQLLIDREVMNVDTITFEDPQPDKEEMLVSTYSSVVTYSTFKKMEGGTYTCYFEPETNEFVQQIQENLRKKYYVLYGKDIDASKVKIHRISKSKQRVVKYKGFVIKGYDCRFKVQGPRELLKIALDCGLGSKNSQGFGCIGLIQQRKG